MSLYIIVTSDYRKYISTTDTFSRNVYFSPLNTGAARRKIHKIQTDWPGIQQRKIE